jgi:FAD/FMN-containing dehydrogenase
MSLDNQFSRFEHGRGVAAIAPATHSLSSAEAAEWSELSKRVKVYGGAAMAGTILASILLAHRWLLFEIASSGSEFPRISWAYHGIESPLVAYIFFAGYYALFRSSRANVHRLQRHIGFACMVQWAFFSFESMSLIDAFHRNADWGERLVYALGALLMLIGAGWGKSILLRLNDYLSPPLDPRFAHPRTEEEIIQLVKQARAQGVQLRVRGAGHLRPLRGTYTDEGPEHINVQLDRYTRILDWDEERKRVTVQAGCHLGVDPDDPLSNKKNSLLWQLDAHRWALPDLGGITHQTVAGFVSTGSMGGTSHHDFGGSIVGLRLIDGTGKVHELAPNPDDPDDKQTNPFYAAGVSLGLLGILSTVTFQCVESYELEGEQVTRDAHEVLEPGRLRRALEQDEYTRLLWWPQQGVEKVEHWRAARHEDRRARARRYSERVRGWYGRVSTRRFKRRPFVSVPRVAQWLIANPFYNFLARDGLPYEPRTERLVCRVLNTFVRKGRKPFRDFWHEALPMDNQVSYKHMPTDFTEMFIDISRADEVTKVLMEFFCPDPRSDPDGCEDARGMRRTGAYAFEIYAGYRSDFWISPAYGANHSFRLDVFWFRSSDQDRERFFNQFWKLLRDRGINFRMHWGKYLPMQGSSEWAQYLSEQYPMRERFMEVRRKMDPDEIFLSTYWRLHLGIPGAHPARVPAARERPRNVVARRKEATLRRARRGQMHVSIVLLKAYFGLIDLILEAAEWASGRHPALTTPAAARRAHEADA